MLNGNTEAVQNRTASLSECVCTQACILLACRETNAAGTEVKFKNNSTRHVNILKQYKYAC